MLLPCFNQVFSIMEGMQAFLQELYFMQYSGQQTAYGPCMIRTHTRLVSNKCHFDRQMEWLLESNRTEVPGMHRSTKNSPGDDGDCVSWRAKEHYERVN